MDDGISVIGETSPDELAVSTWTAIKDDKGPSTSPDTNPDSAITEVGGPTTHMRIRVLELSMKEMALALSNAMELLSQNAD